MFRASSRTKAVRVFLLCVLAMPMLAVRLKLAADVWPPFTDVKGGNRVALDLVETALERAGIEAETEIRSRFATITRDLKTGDLDGGAALWWDAEREKFLAYSTPYLENRLVLLGLNGSDVSARRLSDLVGKRVAIVEGYSYGDMLESERGPTFVRGSSEQANFEKLLAREVDYLLTDALLVHDLFERDRPRAARELALGKTPLLRRSLHLAIRRDREDALELIRRFEAELAKMIADGSYNRTLGVAWIEADIDGDGRREMILGGTHAGDEEPTDGYVLFGPIHDAESDDKESPDRRYVVEGRAYDDWGSVPLEYRSRAEQGNAAIPKVSVFTW